MTFRQSDGPAVSAAKAAISTATAYRFEQDHRVPSSREKGRGRRRPDPLADFFDAEVVPMLTAAPELRAVAIFDEMRRRHPELSAGARRTLERRIRAWRALHGADQEVIFRQVVPISRDLGCYPPPSPGWKIGALVQRHNGFQAVGFDVAIDPRIAAGLFG